MIEPIKPEQINIHEPIPEAVIEAFNLVVNETFDGTTATVKIVDVCDLIRKNLGSDRFPGRWLSIEPVFGLAGWNVEFDDGIYTFKPKAMKRNL